MFNLPAILIPNGIGVALMLLLLINHKTNVRNAFFGERVFVSMVCLSMFQCIGESLSFMIDGQHFLLAREFSLLLNTLLYVGAVLFGFLWVIYIDYKFFAQPARIRRIYPLMSIPFLFALALLILNLFTSIFFSVTPENVYVRSPYVFLFYLIVYAYLLYGMFFAFRQRQHVKKYIFFPVLLFLVPVFIGTLIQFLSYGLSLMWASTSIALTSLYISLQNESSYVDPLTGLYNRQYFNRIIVEHVRHANPKKTLGGIMLDVDDFKSINDTFGHCTGDDALRDVGALLHDVGGPHALAVRFGGDEFVLLMPVSAEAEITEMVQLIRTKAHEFNRTQVRPYRISFSIGAGMLMPQDASVESFIKHLDEQMYATKNTPR